MADIDWSKGSLSGPDGKPVDTTDWSSGVLTEPPKPSGAIRKLIGDKALGFASGAVGVTKALTDSAGAGNKASQVLGSINDGINDYLSPEAKADQQAIAAGMADAKAKGFNLEGVKAGANAFATAPGQFVAQAAGSAAPFIVAGALSGGSAVPAMLGLAAGAGTAKGSIYDEIKKRGGTEADATKAQEYSGANVDQIALSSGLGVLDSFTGVAGSGARMLRGAIGKEVAKEAANTTQRGILGRAGMGMLKEMPLEAAQGGQEQVAANLAAQRAGYEAGTWDNVASNATLEALASAGPGAAFGAMDTTTRQTTPPTAPNQAPTDQAPPLQLGNTPDPLLSFPDGTVARRSEIDAYINGLPADQQPAARAKMMGLAPQPAYTPLSATQPAQTDSQIPLSGPSVQAMEQAQALAPVAQAGQDQNTAALSTSGNGNASGVAPQPVKPSEAMGLDPAAGPISAAAVTAVDTGAHQEIQLQQANEADQAAYEQATAEPEQKVSAPKPTPAAHEYSPYADANGDIVSMDQQPFRTFREALIQRQFENKAAGRNDFEAIKTGENQFVVRRVRYPEKQSNGPSTEVQSGDTGSTGVRSTDSPASVGVGATDGNGVGANAGGLEASSVGEPRQLPSEVPATPVARGNTQPTTLGTQTNATAGPGFTAKDVLRVQNPAPAASDTKTEAASVEAPTAVAGDAATAGKLPGAGSAAVESVGVSLGERAIREQASVATSGYDTEKKLRFADFAESLAGQSKEAIQKAIVNSEFGTGLAVNELDGVSKSIAESASLVAGQARKNAAPKAESTPAQKLENQIKFQKLRLEQASDAIRSATDTDRFGLPVENGPKKQSAIKRHADAQQKLSELERELSEIGKQDASAANRAKLKAKNTPTVKESSTVQPVSQPPKEPNGTQAAQAQSQQTKPEAGPVPATAQPAASDGVAAATEAGKPAEPVAKKTKPNKLQQKVEQARQARADYFTPGNIVNSYGGQDEVLSYTTNDNGGFAVKVHAVKKVDGQWIRQGKPQDARTHSTQPDAKELAKGPVARLGHQSAGEVVYSEPRSDGQPFPNAVDRGVAPPAAAPEEAPAQASTSRPGEPTAEQIESVGDVVRITKSAGKEIKRTVNAREAMKAINERADALEMVRKCLA